MPSPLYLLVCNYKDNSTIDAALDESVRLVDVDIFEKNASPYCVSVRLAGSVLGYSVWMDSKLSCLKYRELFQDYE